MQPIYEKINDMFESFVEDNQKWLHELKYGTVTALRDIAGLGILQEPLSVVYIGKAKGGTEQHAGYDISAGPRYIFLDKDFGKVYVFSGENNARRHRELIGGKR